MSPIARQMVTLLVPVSQLPLVATCCLAPLPCGLMRLASIYEMVGVMCRFCPLRASDVNDYGPRSWLQEVLA